MLESIKDANTVCKSIYVNISAYLATLITDVTRCHFYRYWQNRSQGPNEREDYWIYTLKIKALMGLNMEDRSLDYQR